MKTNSWFFHIKRKISNPLGNLAKHPPAMPSISEVDNTIPDTQSKIQNKPHEHRSPPHTLLILLLWQDGFLYLSQYLVSQTLPWILRWTLGSDAFRAITRATSSSVTDVTHTSPTVSPKQRLSISWEQQGRRCHQLPAALPSKGLFPGSSRDCL